MADLDITLHHLNASRSERLFWLLEELNLPYKVKVWYRTPTRAAPAGLKDVSPLGKAPVLVVNGETIPESGAIVHYLLSLPNVPVPEGLEQKPSKSSIYYSHYSEGSLMTLLQMGATIAASSKAWAGGLVGGLGEEGKTGVAKYSGWLSKDYLRPQIQTHLHEIEKSLAASKGGYFSGSSEPGEGDFMMFFPINSLLAGSRRDDGYEIGPATRKWHELVMARPAAQKGMARLQKEEEDQKESADGKSKI